MINEIQAVTLNCGTPPENTDNLGHGILDV
jgi:hypothetical protein